MKGRAQEDVISVHGGLMAASIPPRINMSCPGFVTWLMKTTVRCGPSGGAVVGVIVVVLAGRVEVGEVGGRVVNPASQPRQAAKMGSS